MGYIPRINLPAEGVEHARWLERGRLDHETRIESLEKLVKALSQANAAAARPTNQSSETVTGIPMPPLNGAVLRGNGTRALWSREWQGLMPEYWVSLDPAGGSYYVTGVGFTGDGVADDGLSKSALPPVNFDDGGLTMLPIDVAGYAGADVGSISGRAQTPIHLHVDVNPSFDGEEFTIFLPKFDNTNGATTPFYTFELENFSAFSATVHIEHTALFYEGTLTPVMGTLDPWPIEADFHAAWWVRNVKNWGATAVPSVFWNGSTASFTDAYYEANVYTP